LGRKKAWLRRLKSTYGDQVEVVLIVPTSGHIWGSPPLSVADEARAIRWLFLDHLKLPVTVFVDPLSVTKRDDGQLLRGESKNIGAVTGRVPEAEAFAPAIFDKDRRLYITGSSPSEARVKAWVARALREEKASANAASPQGDAK